MAFAGHRLAGCRQVAGLTQEALGRKVGANRAQISQYENEHKVPKLLRIQALAWALGVQVDDLLDERGVHVV